MNLGRDILFFHWTGESLINLSLSNNWEGLGALGQNIVEKSLENLKEISPDFRSGKSNAWETKGAEKILTRRKYLDLHSAIRTVDKYKEMVRKLLHGKPELLWIVRRARLLFLAVSRWHCELARTPGDWWWRK